MKITNKVTIYNKGIDINVGDVFYSKKTDEIALITYIGREYTNGYSPIGIFFFNANRYEELTDNYILDPSWVKVSAELIINNK